MKLDLGGIIPDAAMVSELGTMLSRVVTFDLAEPAQRARIREEAVRLESQGLCQRDIGKRLAEPTSQAAVFDALSLDRRMRKQGLDSPYVFVGEPPEDYSKLCRHKNPRYRFEPIAGFSPPPLE